MCATLDNKFSRSIFLWVGEYILKPNHLKICNVYLLTSSLACFLACFLLAYDLFSHDINITPRVFRSRQTDEKKRMVLTTLLKIQVSRSVKQVISNVRPLLKRQKTRPYIRCPDKIRKALWRKWWPGISSILQSFGQNNCMVPPEDSLIFSQKPILFLVVNFFVCLNGTIFSRKIIRMFIAYRFTGVQPTNAPFIFYFSTQH